MPIYEYQCKKCGHHLEVIQSFNDEPLTDCPDCHQASLTKLLSAPAFHLKGSGWYATDYKNPPANKSETSAEAAKPTENKVEESKANPSQKPKEADSTA